MVRKHLSNEIYSLFYIVVFLKIGLDYPMSIYDKYGFYPVRNDKRMELMDFVSETVDELRDRREIARDAIDSGVYMPLGFVYFTMAINMGSPVLIALFCLAAAPLIGMSVYQNNKARLIDDKIELANNMRFRSPRMHFCKHFPFKFNDYLEDKARRNFKFKVFGIPVPFVKIKPDKYTFMFNYNSRKAIEEISTKPEKATILKPL